MANYKVSMTKEKETEQPQTKYKNGEFMLFDASGDDLLVTC
jgi:hypothetical protein